MPIVRFDEKDKKQDYGVLLTACAQYNGPPLPPLVVLTATNAVRRMTQKCPGLRSEVVRENQLVTMCYVSNPVRLMVDRYSKQGRGNSKYWLG
jgi:hypothetical protein